ncbi:MAG TPA: YbaN family protein [Candidatus Krumholzibacteria bacterium]|nr:YbaN family protein [Candidatus Krumholzibacteria bacterium]HRX50636.1 YbaN family protein [Candidatus Krumholzibacteria bacterium]
MRRIGLQTVGWAALAVGAVGLVVPLLPTTVFWLAAAWCFARSRPELRDRLYRHPAVGPALADLLERGEASGAVKRAALSGMAVGFGVAALAIGARPAPLAVLGAALTAVAVWVLTRPEPARPRAADPAA